MSFPTGFIIGERLPGIVQKMGKSAGEEANYSFYATDPNGSPCILMYCNPGAYVILDNGASLNSIHRISDKLVTWFVMQCGYAAAHYGDSCLYLHQHLMQHSGNGKGQESIDHINMNKLDNRRANLRIVSQSIQNTNRGKVARHRTARELPEEISTPLPKFIVYYKEAVNNTTRDFFTVEGHPIQKQKADGIISNATNQLSSHRWATSKSAAFSILDKLEQAKLFLRELDKLADCPTYIITVPKLIKVTAQKSPILEPQQVTSQPKPRTVDKSHLVQWKKKQIYEAICGDEAHIYKAFCEKNNDLSTIDWATMWNTFINSVSEKTYDDAIPVIDAFILNLRSGRHNTLVQEYNMTRNSPEREDRQQWPSATILKVYNEGRLELFKDWLIKEDGDIGRWDDFEGSLLAAETDIDRKEIIQRFLRNRRSRKWRSSKE